MTTNEHNLSVNEIFGQTCMCLSTEKVFHVVMCADSDIFGKMLKKRYVKRLNNQEVLIIHEVLFLSFFLQYTKTNPPSQIHSAYKG